MIIAAQAVMSLSVQIVLAMRLFLPSVSVVNKTNWRLLNHL